VLRLRFIGGLSWNDTAEESGYSLRQAIRISNILK